MSSVAGVLGILTLKLGKYVVVITKSRPVGRLRGHPVHKVEATDLLPLRAPHVQAADPDETAYLALIRGLLARSPLYFSYALDLTNSAQRQAAADPAAPLWARADDRFFWNKHLAADLIAAARARPADHDGVSGYILPVICGMVDIAPATRLHGRGRPFTFALLTRRSRHRAGTRYFTRGVDEHGHVANYNETEQLIVLGDSGAAEARMPGFGGADSPHSTQPAETDTDADVQVLSYVQTRGSVPVYWAEINTLKYTPTLQVRPVGAALHAARAHFREQVDLYGENYLVNLVNQSGREKRVKDAYEEVVQSLISSPEIVHNSPAVPDVADRTRVIESEKTATTAPAATAATAATAGPSAADDANPMNHLHYIYFDFHSETKGLRWHRAELLLQKLQPGLIQGQYFYGVQAPASRGGAGPDLHVRTTQKAVVRTNCMDCLDRTNVVQSMLGRWALNRQLADVGVLRAGESAFDDPAFAHAFRNVWADNADAVSRTYSGTGALKTDFTRTGERTRLGMLQDGRNSAVRWLRNNFLDGARQDAFDVWHGTYVPADHYRARERQLADARPLAIQSVPYVLGASAFLALLSLATGAPGLLKKLATGAVILLVAWEARKYLRQAYNVAAYLARRQAHAAAGKGGSGSAKEQSKAPTRSSGVSGNLFWQVSLKSELALTDRDSMVAVCRDLAGLLAVDDELNVSGGNGDDDELGDMVGVLDDPLLGGAGVTASPTKKRKAPATSGGSGGGRGGKRARVSGVSRRKRLDDDEEFVDE
ncbi:hypothetical protein KEM52_001815 [Ascosphaera acerosa]|nr:hypothetical protein KEM52_001815 [Ascosphaera acerosa]